MGFNGEAVLQSIKSLIGFVECKHGCFWSFQFCGCSHCWIMWTMWLIQVLSLFKEYQKSKVSLLVLINMHQLRHRAGELTVLVKSNPAGLIRYRSFWRSSSPLGLLQERSYACAGSNCSVLKQSVLPAGDRVEVRKVLLICKYLTVSFLCVLILIVPIVFRFYGCDYPDMTVVRECKWTLGNW